MVRKLTSLSLFDGFNESSNNDLESPKEDRSFAENQAIRKKTDAYSPPSKPIVLPPQLEPTEPYAQIPLLPAYPPSRPQTPSTTTQKDHSTSAKFKLYVFALTVKSYVVHYYPVFLFYMTLFVLGLIFGKLLFGRSVTPLPVSVNPPQVSSLSRSVDSVLNQVMLFP
jgi:hypothetical protein